MTLSQKNDDEHVEFINGSDFDSLDVGADVTFINSLGYIPKKLLFLVSLTMED